jgi:hypothetical protein
MANNVADPGPDDPDGRNRRAWSGHCNDTVIQDRANSGKTWVSTAGGQPTSEDYAIVSRIIDSKTGNCLIFLGGRTQFGTEAAGELVTAGGLANALRGAPTAWPKKNLQFVIRTQIHGLTPSSPVVVASHFW